MQLKLFLREFPVPERLWPRVKKILVLASVVLAKENFSFAQEADSSFKEKALQIHAEVSAFFIPDESYLNPIVWVKEHHLHFEARYNYEDFQTASFFAGYNFEVGNKLHLDATPLFGFSVGNTNAIVPGVEAELMYWHVGIYVETEYVADLKNDQGSYFSYWGELYYSPAEWIWFGLATQRIAAQETGADVQRGFMLALQKKWFTVTGYYFNPFASDDYGVLTLGVTF